jgi:hypothetical protein
VQQVLVAVPASERKDKIGLRAKKAQLARNREASSVGGAYGGTEIDIDSLNFATGSQLVLGVITT